MQTITGTIEDVAGQPVHCRVTVVSLSTPLFADAGVITGNTTLSALTDPDDGTFEFDLRPGYYQVTYATVPKATTFKINVTGTTGTADVDDLVVAEAAAVLAGASQLVLLDQGNGQQVRIGVQNGQLMILD